MRKLKLLILIVFGFLGIESLAATPGTFHGYLKRDIKVLDGNEMVAKGTEITCKPNRTNDKCCYEDEAGEVCINLSDLSAQKIPKRDFAIESITYSDTNTTEKDACSQGKDYREDTDAFKWSYGVRLKKNFEGRVMIYITHIAKRGPLKIPLPGMTKMWSGPVDSKCHAFNFTKNDVNQFLKSYQSLGPYLDPALDLNLQVEVVVQVFSEFEEDNYKNNEIRFPALLPVNSDSEWPPRKIK